MVLIAPTLDVDEPATRERIAEIIPALAGRDDPFAILEAGELTYMQTCWTEHGYELEYQDGDLEQHYRVRDGGLTAADVVRAMQDYLDGSPAWRPRFVFDQEPVGAR